MARNKSILTEAKQIERAVTLINLGARLQVLESETDLSYLMLAQSLIRVDTEQALYRLGISEDTARLIGTLTPAQMMKIAASNTLLCRFRMDDDMVWGLLTNHGKTGAANDVTTRLHASILMAGRHQEAA